jgi:hypothetical protein
MRVHVCVSVSVSVCLCVCVCVCTCIQIHENERARLDYLNEVKRRAEEEKRLLEMEMLRLQDDLRSERASRIEAVCLSACLSVCSYACVCGSTIHGKQASAKSR